MVSQKLFDDSGTESGLSQSREHAHSGNDTFDGGEKDLKITVSHLKCVFSSFQILIFNLS